jgi:hypothetical protein
MTYSRRTGSARRLGWPSKARKQGPAGVLRGSGNLHGIPRPYSDVGTEVHGPGVPLPVRSAFRVSHPLDGLLPPSFPATRTGAAHGVHPSELFPPTEPYALRRLCPLVVSGIAYSCSENQKFTMPRDSRALLPARIRTRRRSEPTPSRCSPGVFDASPERSPSAAGSTSRTLPSCALSVRPARGLAAGASGP